MHGIRRLGLLVTVTSAAFALAIGRFESAAQDGCAQRARTDPSYRVDLTAVGGSGAAATDDASEMGGMEMGGTEMGGSADTADPPPTTYRLRVFRDGRPVPGAHVCLAAYMRGMSAMAVVGHATETVPGTYEVTVDYAMGGEWKARVVVDERGRPAAATPFDLVAR